MDIENVIGAWHAAVNDSDDASLRTLVTDDVALAGPKGTTSGITEVIAWVRRSGINLEAIDWHPVSTEEMVVEESATWPGSDGQPVYSRYRVIAGKIAAIQRFGELSAALAGNAPQYPPQ